MRESPRRILVILLALLPFTAALVILFRNAIREMVVIPILYLIWLGGLGFRSIPQGFFWGVLVAATVFLFFGSLSRKPDSGPRLYQAEDPAGRQSRRIALWAREVKRNTNESPRSLRTLLELRRLILAVWSYRRHISIESLDQEIRLGEVEIPPEWRIYFEQDRSPSAQDSSLQRAVGRIRAWFGKDAATNSASEQQLEAAIRSLEAEFEVERRE